MAFQFGGIDYENNLFMAPMEGITDVPFRRMVRKFGCAVTCTQMIHAEGLLRGEQHRMHEVTAIDPAEKPVGIQLCGSNAEIIADAGQKAQDMGFAFVDINMGCPAKNVVANGSGSALLKTPLLAGEIVRKLKARIQIPVTVKVRAGWDHDYKSGLEVGKLIEDEGASLVTIHARTRSQKFKGHADWNLIQELKDKVKIPVVGNGDVFRPSDVAKMRGTTPADGVMVARGALGNPWLFSERYPTVQEIRDTMLEHLTHHLDFYPNKNRALITFRKHVAWYTKGLPHSSPFRVAAFKEPTLEGFLKMFHAFFDALDPALVVEQGGTPQEGEKA